MDLIKNTAMEINKKKNAYHLVGFNLTTSEFWGACSATCNSYGFFLKFPFQWVTSSSPHLLINPLAITIKDIFHKARIALSKDLGIAVSSKSRQYFKPFMILLLLLIVAASIFFTKNKIKNKRAWFRFFDILSNDFLFLFFCCWDEKSNRKLFSIFWFQSERKGRCWNKNSSPCCLAFPRPVLVTKFPKNWF